MYGQGYAWSPSALIASVGDTVVWLWDAPAFVSGLGYRVFSVSSPSSTDYDGIAFSSGNTQTAKGTNNNNYCFYLLTLLILIYIKQDKQNYIK